MKSTRRQSISSRTMTGGVQEPTVLPSRFPNLLANGSGGIAVGMATNIPPHNLRRARRCGVLVPGELRRRRRGHAGRGHRTVKGPDFPTRGLIVGSQGINDTYTTGRGSIRMRGVVEIEEDSAVATAHRHHRAAVSGQPRQLHHLDRRAGPRRQADRNLEHRGPVERPRRPAHRRRDQRDAVAKVVLNNLYKHTQLQTSFGANMLSIVDGVPHAAAGPTDPALRRPSARRHRPAHHVPAAQGQRAGPHPARSGQGARRAGRSDRADPRVGNRRRRQAGPDRALDIDEIQAQAILDMQLRRLAALERQKIVDDLAKIEAEIADL